MIKNVNLYDAIYLFSQYGKCKDILECVRCGSNKNCESGMTGDALLDATPSLRPHLN